MVRKLAGKNLDERPTASDLELAKRTVHNRFIVGLMNEFEESIHRFNTAMGIDESEKQVKKCMDQFFVKDEKMNSNPHPRVSADAKANDGWGDDGTAIDEGGAGCRRWSPMRRERETRPACECFSSISVRRFYSHKFYLRVLPRSKEGVLLGNFSPDITHLIWSCMSMPFSFLTSRNGFLGCLMISRRDDVSSVSVSSKMNPVGRLTSMRNQSRVNIMLLS
jgi:hypothetical protein